KLDRISDARVLDAGAYVPSDMQLEKLVADSWGIWMDAPVEHIELVFSAEAAPRARETRWHPSQHVRSLSGGRLRMTLDVRGVVEITPWVLSWGADVEVVGPPALRQRVTEAARGMAASY